MKRIAVVSDATSNGFFFPLWVRYYGNYFGQENLYVGTYTETESLFVNIPHINFWRIGGTYSEESRIVRVAQFINDLLKTYDIVIRCDIDEYLVPDLSRYSNLSDYVERLEFPYVTAHGIDVVEFQKQTPLDISKTILIEQRSYGIPTTLMSKTCITTIPLEWSFGFHQCSAPPVFQHLFNIHLKKPILLVGLTGVGI